MLSSTASAASFRPPGAYRVHITPSVLSAASCKAVIGLAEQYAAEHNGWESDRHGKHATVDLAVRKYPPLLQLLQPTLDHVAGNLPPVTYQLLTTVRLKTIGNDIIKNVGKSESCMVSKLPIVFKRTCTSWIRLACAQAELWPVGE